jgi:hypothetical protein
LPVKQLQTWRMIFKAIGIVVALYTLYAAVFGRV